MPASITEANLRQLIDLLVKEGKLVVGPRSSGSTILYEPLTTGNDLSTEHLPPRSPKETFLPLCEDILSFERVDGKMAISDIDRSRIPEMVLVGVPPCDAASPGILDSVFSWDYLDEFYLERRRKTTIIGIACTHGDDACFCSTVGFGPEDQQGSDLFLTPVEGGSYTCTVLTDKGEAMLKAHAGLFKDLAGAKPLPIPKQEVPPLDLAKIKKWLDDHFDDPLWTRFSEICAGCGACAFICPTCHCFDINDEGNPDHGTRRKHWDACGFGKFTNHASGHNPRDVQNKRYRNRIMHKFKYYNDKFGKTLCTGCGRCIRACPVGIDILTILEEINSK